MAFYGHDFGPLEAPRPIPQFFLSLDLGKISDPSALAIVEMTPGLDGEPPLFDVRDLIRFQLNTPYPAVVAKVRELARHPALRPRVEQPPDYFGTIKIVRAPRPTLVIDAGGVGVAVVDMFVDARPPIEATITPLSITGGDSSREAEWGETGLTAHWVAKGQLVSSVQAALQSHRLRIVPTLAMAPILRSELLNFEVRVTRAANETYGSNDRDGVHDDLVLAVAMACWLGSRRLGICAWGPNPTYPRREREPDQRPHW